QDDAGSSRRAVRRSGQAAPERQPALEREGSAGEIRDPVCRAAPRPWLDGDVAVAGPGRGFADELRVRAGEDSGGLRQLAASWPRSERTLGGKLGYDWPMNRRHFIGLLGSAAGWPIVARAQQAMPVVGYLGGSTPHRAEYQLRSIREGLREAGYINGQNVTFESRWAENRNGRLP